MSAYRHEVVAAVIGVLVGEAADEWQARGDKAPDLVLERLVPNVVVANKARLGIEITEEDLETLHASVAQAVRKLLK